MDNKDYEQLDRMYITPKECAVNKSQLTTGILKLDSKIDVLEENQKEIKVDVKEIKEVIMEQRVRRKMFKRAINSLSFLSKHARVIILILSTIATSLGIAGVVYALG